MEKLSSPSLTAANSLTIADYWQSHGFSKEEAKQIERQQMKEALAREALYDSMENDPF